MGSRLTVVLDLLVVLDRLGGELACDMSVAGCGVHTILAELLQRPEEQKVV
jgi:hypothetical protein